MKIDLAFGGRFCGDVRDEDSTRRQEIQSAVSGFRSVDTTKMFSA